MGQDDDDEEEGDESELLVVGQDEGHGVGEVRLSHVDPAQLRRAQILGLGSVVLVLAMCTFAGYLHWPPWGGYSPAPSGSSAYPTTPLPPLSWPRPKGQPLPISPLPPQPLPASPPLPPEAAAAAAPFGVAAGSPLGGGYQPSVAGVTTGRALLESHDLALVAADRTLAAGKDVLRPEDRTLVEDLAAATLRNLSGSIRDIAPATARGLEALSLSASERDAVLHVVRRMSDPRVQSLGSDVGSAALRGAVGGKEESIRELIAESLETRLDEIRQLRKDILPPVLRPTSPQGQGVDLDALHMLRSFHPKTGPDGRLRGFPALHGRRLADADWRANPAARALTAGEKFGVIGSLIEQARVVLDQLAALARKAGGRLEVPDWSVVGGVDLLSELGSCLEAATSSVDLQIACPMRLCSAGIDVLNVVGNTPPPGIGGALGPRGL